MSQQQAGHQQPAPVTQLEEPALTGKVAKPAAVARQPIQTKTGGKSENQKIVLAVGVMILVLVQIKPFCDELCNNYSVIAALANAAIRTVNFFMAPLGWIVAGLFAWLLAHYRQPRDRGTEEDGYDLLKHATKLECAYRIPEALAAYADIAQRYSHTPAGRDAQISLETLQKKTQ